MNRFLTSVCSLSVLLLLQQPLLAQTEEVPQKEAPVPANTEESFTTDKPLTIDFEEEKKEEEEVPEKKRKKNVFYDLKTRKGFTKSGYGAAEKIQLFHLLREWQDPDPYVRDIHWYEYKSKTVKVGGNPTPDKGMLLHGPYKVLKDDQVVEEGIFYLGAKHGRWTTYRKMYDYYVLDNKEKYFKGWPKESEVVYYSDKAKSLQEVIPVEYGKKEGNYFYFFEDGRLAVKGEYRFDEKVGMWTEYYPGPKQRRKRVVQYPPTPWEEKHTPYILQEWDKEGKLIYEARKK
jgi:antitoxin component YwqK of YwqJK toxin-antitoxin module